MSLFVSNSVNPSPSGKPYVFAGNTRRGGLKITAAGASGTLKLYSKINGVSVLLRDETITCNPALVIEEILGSDVDFVVHIASTVCVQLQVADVNATLVNSADVTLGDVSLGDITVDTTPQSGGSGQFYLNSSGALIWVDRIYDEETKTASYKLVGGADAGTPGVDFFSIKSASNEPTYQVITDSTQNYAANTAKSLTVTVDGPGATISIDGATAQPIPDKLSLTWTADQKLNKSFAFVVPSGTTLYTWRTL